jgi:flagellar assembly protein FliH
MGRIVKNATFRSERYHVRGPQVPASDEHDGRAESALDADLAQSESVREPADLQQVREALADVATQAQTLIDDAQFRARALLDDAYAPARLVLENAAQRADDLVEGVKATAHADGYAAGEAAAHERTSEMIETIKSLVVSTREARRALIPSAERILLHEVERNSASVVELARETVARLVERETVTIRVHPGDLEQIRKHRDEFLDVGDIQQLRIVEDQRVDRGGVMVETDGGTIDARVTTQLNEARRVLGLETVPPVMTPNATTGPGANVPESQRPC